MIPDFFGLDYFSYFSLLWGTVNWPTEGVLFISLDGLHEFVIETNGDISSGYFLEVTFDIDANGILNVTAKDNATGKDQKITITSSSGLSKEEVERMAKEADAHSAEDKTRREEIEAKNQLDSMVYNIEKMLKEHGDKISGSERGDVENALADAKKAIEGGDKAAMDSAREKLTAASHKLAEQMYKATQAAPGAGGAGPSGPGAAPGSNGDGQKKDEGVIDAEYVDVEDKK